MGTVAIRRPPTVLLSEAQDEGAGQQLSWGRQWHRDSDAPTTEATAATVANQSFIVGMKKKRKAWLSLPIGRSTAIIWGKQTFFGLKMGKPLVLIFLYASRRCSQVRLNREHYYRGSGYLICIGLTGNEPIWGPIYGLATLHYGDSPNALILGS